jgi:phosphoglycerol geranylgeranyltransferase
VNRATKILQSISSRQKQIAVLVDPEKSEDENQLKELLKKCEFAQIDYIFIGGSTVTRQQFENTARFIRQNTTIPLVIFPGSAQQLSQDADALLYLSLLSGRNPDFLIGHHIQSALELNELNLEVIPTAYLLIDGGTQSSVAYVSQTTPIPRHNSTVVKQIVLAAKFQGKKIVYLDAGSGAIYCVQEEMIRMVSKLGMPLIIGGGVRDIDSLRAIHEAGANVVVIGNKLETDIDFLLEIHAYKTANEIELNKSNR